MDIKRAIGKAIKLYRQKKGLSRDYLATLAGVSSATCANIESARTHGENVYKVCSVLDVKYSAIMVLAEQIMAHPEIAASTKMDGETESQASDRIINSLLSKRK